MKSSGDLLASSAAIAWPRKFLGFVFFFWVFLGLGDLGFRGLLHWIFGFRAYRVSKFRVASCMWVEAKVYCRRALTIGSFFLYILQPSSYPQS